MVSQIVQIQDGDFPYVYDGKVLIQPNWKSPLGAEFQAFYWIAFDCPFEGEIYLCGQRIKVAKGINFKHIQPTKHMTTTLGIHIIAVLWPMILFG